MAYVALRPVPQKLEAEMVPPDHQLTRASIIRLR